MPLAAFLTAIPLLWMLYCHGQRDSGNFRIAFLRAMLACGVLVVLFTESLSLFHLLTPEIVGKTWWLAAFVVVLLLLGNFVFRCKGSRQWQSCLRSADAAFRQGISRIRNASAEEMVFFGFLFLWLAVLFIVALVAAPNNFDSMTYRLPRIMHWAANHSIAFYPTEVIRELDRSPFAEWVLLHIYLLTGQDCLFNLQQWFCLVGSCVAVFEISAIFTPGRAARYLAVILTVTTPMAVLQATSTQNNLVAAFFFLCFVLFGLRLSQGKVSPAHNIEDAIYCGAALGLAVLTQTTSLLYAAPFCLWFAGRMLWQMRWRTLLSGVLCGLVAILLLSGYAWRNWQMFHHPLGPHGEPPSRFDPNSDREAVAISYENSKMNLPFFLSNLGRNAAMHLAMPIQNYNESMHWMVKRVHEFFGLNINEPATTLAGCYFMLTADKHEEFAGNLPQAALILAAFAVLPFRAGRISSSLPLYGLCLLCGFGLLSFIVCWEPFHPRVELPIFFAACPFVVSVLPLERRIWLAAMLSGFCAAYALPYLMDNYRRPMFGEKSVFMRPRELQYFRDFPQWFQDYYDAARLIKKGGYESVGLQADSHDFHYPIWPFLRKITKRDVGFHEVNVTNVSRNLATATAPDAVLVTHALNDETLAVEGRPYRRIWKGKQLSLFEASK